MKNHLILAMVACATALSTTLSAAPPKKSLLDNDPQVLYMNQYTAKPIEFITTEQTSVFASKKGKSSRKLGSFTAGTKVTLIAMDENAYRVSGKGKHGKMKGWISPKKLASTDPKFVENLKLLYQRQMIINALIANKEVAIGMTIDEVKLSLGEPTKKTSKVTKEGRSGVWEFIKFEERKHYNYVTDPQSGRTYKRLSHVTTEEKAKITVEFENNVVSSISSMEDNGPDKIKIINPPIILGF